MPVFVECKFGVDPSGTVAPADLEDELAKSRTCARGLVQMSMLSNIDVSKPGETISRATEIFDVAYRYHQWSFPAARDVGRGSDSRRAQGALEGALGSEEAKRQQIVSL